MATRRGFLARLLATLPALPFLPRLASAAPTTPTTPTRPVSASPGIPRQMDIRGEIHPLAFDIEVSRHGEKLSNAVAYDLDADTVTVITEWKSPHWRIRPPLSYRTLHGGVSVRWVDGPR